jgi:acyl transferase domain-containing protein
MAVQTDVAIVGMACILPKAPDMLAFWSNILNKVNGITEIPSNRWDWRRYYDPDPRAPDKVYSRWGGFIDPVPFDPGSYGMPPNSLRSIDPVQLLTLEVARAALADAGCLERPFARDRTGVVLGAGGGSGDLGQGYLFRSSLPLYVENGTAQIMAQLPEWTEDSFPGVLLNVIAGRVANRFDLGGVNYTVDSACASSLTAVYVAVRELQAGAADMMLAGGADCIQNPFAYLCFSKTLALSPRGQCRPFDVRADGIAISEGIAIVVLKRLADAARDGDRIYAVIKAVGGSSDGRDRGLTAPRPDGQVRALERAYAAAGFSPETLELVEAHGTGTVVGDQVEAESLTRVMKARRAMRQTCAIGSVKSMIGHTKPAAGVAGLIKVALSLYHRVLPATINVEQPNPRAFGPDSPLYVNTETRPWVERPDGIPRRAGVSAFGFGGTNFHAVLEEYPGPEPPALVATWPTEVCVWRSANRTKLDQALQTLDRQLSGGATPPLRDLARSLWDEVRTSPEEPVAGAALAVVAESLADLRDKVREARERLGAPTRTFTDERGIFFADEPFPRQDGIAWLYPSVDAVHVDVGLELALYFPEMRRALGRAGRTLADFLPGPLATYIYPPPRFSAEEQHERAEALAQPNVVGPVLGAFCLGLGQLVAACGLRPTAMAGLDAGERVALAAAGVLDEDDLYRLVEAWGRQVTSAGFDGTGAKQMREAFARHLRALRLGTPRVAVFSGATAQAYPTEPEAIPEIGAHQAVASLAFPDVVEALYQSGARTFVEVGPGDALARLVRARLAGRPHVAVAPARAGLRAFQAAIAELFVRGVTVDLTRLFTGRNTRRLDLANLAGETATSPMSPTTWLVHGGRAWPARQEPPGPPVPVGLPVTSTALQLAELGETESSGLSVVGEAQAVSLAPVLGPAKPLPTVGESPVEPVFDGQEGDVMLQFQGLMSHFLDTQRSVVLSYLSEVGSASQGGQYWTTEAQE